MKTTTNSQIYHFGKFRLCAIVLALLAGSNAYAATATATSTTINPGRATDTTTGSSATAGDVGNGSFTIDKFNSAGGVLTGVSFSTTFAQEAITFSSSSSSSATGYAYGVGGFSVATGANTVSGTATSLNTSSVSGVKNGTNKTGTIAAYTATASATTQAQLNYFYSSGTVNGTVNEVLYSNLTTGSSLAANNATDRTATITATYTTVNHANGAFGSGAANTLTYSFGDIANGAAAATYSFDLYNALGSYGLQVVSVTPSANNIFALGGIAGTSNLAAGSFAQGTVGMAGQTLAGLYTGSWNIVVADSALGIAAGRTMSANETLTLNVSANVLSAVTPVPEAQTYAMLLAGLGLMVTITRRRRVRRA